MIVKSLKVGQKVFFVSMNRDPVEEVFISHIHDNDIISIKRNGDIVDFSLVKDDSEFIFAMSDEEKFPLHDGFLYLNLELIKKEDQFYDALEGNMGKINKLKIKDKIELTNFIFKLLEK